MTAPLAITAPLAGAPNLGQLLDWAPAFTLVLARVGAVMALAPGLGESTALPIVRVGLALGLSVLLLPILSPGFPPVPPVGLDMALMVASEVVTGLWFGWLARMIALALPIGAQFVAYLLSLSSVLQPDAELGAQSTALARLFEVAVPVIVLASGMYTLVLRALVGLFVLIPPGHMLPSADGAQAAVRGVGNAFTLALQLASPFVVGAIAWYVAMGQIARAMSRVQIFFVMMPGQILGGLCLLGLAAGTMIAVWQRQVEAWLAALPGSG